MRRPVPARRPHRPGGPLARLRPGCYPGPVSSTPEPAGSRHVGRVIDPSVREDGDPEPELSLAASSPEPSELGTEPPPEVGASRGGRVRERLLERARAAQSAAAPPDQWMAPLSPDVPSTETDLLEDLTAPLPSTRAPAAPLPTAPLGRLSPNQVAVFGALLGIATVVSLIALGMLVETQPERPAELTLPKPVQSAPAPEHRPEARPKRVRQKLPGPWRVTDAKDEAKTRLLGGTIGNQAFVKALQGAGVSKAETYRILLAMKGVKDLDHCGRSDRFDVLVDRNDGRVRAFEYTVSAEEVYQARENAEGLLRGTRLDLKIERNQVSGALLVEGDDFDGSAELYGFDQGLSKVVREALEGHLDLEEIESGSRARVIAQEVTVLGEFSRYAGIEALEILPPSGKPLRVYFFDAPGERGYYNAQGRAPYEGGWRKPIKDAPVTSPFNLKRMHPVLKKVMPHLGMDLGADMGTPVGASSYGTVSFIGYAGPSGNLVKVEHHGGIETGYAHLSRFAEGLKVGDRVKRLQLVGYVGSTGRSTGPHLHFSATKKGEFFDPATLNLDSMRTVSSHAREAFQSIRARYDQKLDAVPLPKLPDRIKAKADSSAAPTPGSAAPASATAPAQAEAAPPEAPAKKSVIYLTDQELLELQGKSKKP